MCGVILSLRDWGGTITVWNSDCKAKGQIERVTEGLLRVFPKKKFRYRPHMQSIRDNNKIIHQQKTGSLPPIPEFRPPLPPGLFSYAAVVAAESFHPSYSNSVSPRSHPTTTPSHAAAPTPAGAAAAAHHPSPAKTPAVTLSSVSAPSGTTPAPLAGTTSAEVPPLGPFPLPPHTSSLTVPSSPTGPDEEDEESAEGTTTSTTTTNNTGSVSARERVPSGVFNQITIPESSPPVAEALAFLPEFQKFAPSRSPRSAAMYQWVETVSDPKNSPQLTRRSSFSLRAPPTSK